MANCTQYGLAGSVWSKHRGREVAEKIESGMVWVNTWLHRDLRVPFGGVKDSGVGREGGCGPLVSSRKRSIFASWKIEV